MNVKESGKGGLKRKRMREGAIRNVKGGILESRRVGNVKEGVKGGLKRKKGGIRNVKEGDYKSRKVGMFVYKLHW